MRRKPGRQQAQPEDQVARIDCKGRTVAEVVGPILPWCREARSFGRTPVISLHNLELLGDSVSSLLKSLDRLAVDFGIRVTLADRSGLTRAFLQCLGDAPQPHPRNDGRVIEPGLKRGR